MNRQTDKSEKICGQNKSSLSIFFSFSVDPKLPAVNPGFLRRKATTREWGAVYYLANFTQNRKASFTIVETETDTNIDKWLQYLMTFLSRCSMNTTTKFKTNHFFIDLGNTFDLCQYGHTVRKWENTRFIGALRPPESATAFPDSSWTANTLVKTRPWAVWKECKLPFQPSKSY